MLYEIHYSNTGTTSFLTSVSAYILFDSAFFAEHSFLREANDVQFKLVDWQFAEDFS